MLRLLAYDYGRIPECKFPSRWNDNKITGIDWLQGFMKIRKNRKLCKPENTSLFMVTVFNKTRGMEFFLTIINVHINLVHLLLIERITLMKQECPLLYGHVTLLLSLGQNRLDKLFQVNEEL
jgi:hypothetical protein